MTDVDSLWISRHIEQVNPSMTIEWTAVSYDSSTIGS